MNSLSDIIKGAFTPVFAADETDPIFEAWLGATPPLYSFTETDPVFGAWIEATPPLYSFTEADPVFGAWLTGDFYSSSGSFRADFDWYANCNGLIYAAGGSAYFYGTSTVVDLGNFANGPGFLAAGTDAGNISILDYAGDSYTLTAFLGAGFGVGINGTLISYVESIGSLASSALQSETDPAFNAWYSGEDYARISDGSNAGAIAEPAANMATDVPANETDPVYSANSFAVAMNQDVFTTASPTFNIVTLGEMVDGSGLGLGADGFGTFSLSTGARILAGQGTIVASLIDDGSGNTIQGDGVGNYSLPYAGSLAPGYGTITANVIATGATGDGNSLDISGNAAITFLDGCFTGGFANYAINLYDGFGPAVTGDGFGNYSVQAGGNLIATALASGSQIGGYAIPYVSFGAIVVPGVGDIIPSGGNAGNVANADAAITDQFSNVINTTYEQIASMATDVPANETDPAFNAWYSGEDYARISDGSNAGAIAEPAANMATDVPANETDPVFEAWLTATPPVMPGDLASASVNYANAAGSLASTSAILYDDATAPTSRTAPAGWIKILVNAGSGNVTSWLPYYQ